jgi:DNA-binding transcriptional LysR family regulator
MPRYLTVDSSLFPAGHRVDYLPRCAGGVDVLLEVEQALMTGSNEPSGLVRVAATADFLDFFPMEWMAEFLAAHPRVRLDPVLSDAKADLIAEQIDVAFRGGPLHDLGYVPPLGRRRHELTDRPQGSST